MWSMRCVLEGRSAREVATAHGISKSWIYELIARYRAGGYEALERRSRRPRSCTHETPLEVVEAIVALRGELAKRKATTAGQRRSPTTSLSAWRRPPRGDDLADPQARRADRRRSRRSGPASWLIRFQAELPNEMWQTDITHWQLADGEHVEILNLIDDHSRLFLGSQAYPHVKATDVVDSFHRAAELHGLPASLLSDNGAVFTGSRPRRQGAAAIQSSSGSASPSRTHGPTTPRPAARSSDCTRRSSAT